MPKITISKQPPILPPPTYTVMFEGLTEKQAGILRGLFSNDDKTRGNVVEKNKEEFFKLRELLKGKHDILWGALNGLIEEDYNG